MENSCKPTYFLSTTEPEYSTTSLQHNSPSYSLRVDEVEHSFRDVELLVANPARQAALAVLNDQPWHENKSVKRKCAGLKAAWKPIKLGTRKIISVWNEWIDKKLDKTRCEECKQESTL